MKDYNDNNDNNDNDDNDNSQNDWTWHVISECANLQLTCKLVDNKDLEVGYVELSMSSDTSWNFYVRIFMAARWSQRRLL